MCWSITPCTSLGVGCDCCWPSASAQLSPATGELCGVMFAQGFWWVTQTGGGMFSSHEKYAAVVSSPSCVWWIWRALSPSLSEMGAFVQREVWCLALLLMRITSKTAANTKIQTAPRRPLLLAADTRRHVEEHKYLCSIRSGLFSADQIPYNSHL